MNEQIFQQIIDSWAEERENWNQYEYHIKNLLVIRKNVDEINIYLKELNKVYLDKLYPVYLPLYLLLEKDKINFTDYSNYSIKQKNGAMTDDEIKKELVGKNIITESDYITWDEIPKTEREQYNADWFLNKNKGKYAKITGDDSIGKIIDLMVETFQKTNASKSAFGAPKTIINRNNLKSILIYFQLLQQGNLEEIEESISQIRDMNKIGKEVLGYYNLANNNAFIYNSRVDNVFKLLFADFKENQFLSYIEKYYSALRDEFKKSFSNNLHPAKLLSLLKETDFGLTDSSEANLSINLQIDQMIYNYDEKYLKNEKKNKKNKGEGKVGKRNKSQKINHSLNTILYGPPGTGKTYYTINKAISIIKGVNTEEKLKEEYPTRDDLKKSFDELSITDWYSPTGQIGFITFHQSMSYEDFIEGIKPLKPKEDDIGVKYDIKDGIFKAICVEAAFQIAQSKPLIDAEEVLDFSIAYDRYVEKLEELLSSEGRVELQTKTGGKVLVDSISQMGNIVIKHIDGSRTYTVSKDRLTRLQKEIKNLEEINNINDQFRSVIGGSNSTSYWAVLNAIRKEVPDKDARIKKRIFSWEEKKAVVSTMKKDDYINESAKPYVLIIDEINRGNVSQIFGELITLIEEDKRAGNPEAIEVTLPYSKEKFTVPPNLYIIGTMNTADRSVEALDTALRRRFSFEFMQPRYDLDELDIEVSGIKIPELLKTINERITYILDEDHQIGHSYFMSIKEKETEEQRGDELYTIFRNKIIPLLKEYFYNDYGKIQLILGKEFVETINNNQRLEFADSTAEIYEREQYRMKIDDDGFKIINALNSVLKKKTDQSESES